MLVGLTGLYICSQYSMIRTKRWANKMTSNVRFLLQPSFISRATNSVYRSGSSAVEASNMPSSLQEPRTIYLVFTGTSGSKVSSTFDDDSPIIRLAI